MGKVLTSLLSLLGGFSSEEVGKLPSVPLDCDQPWWFSSEEPELQKGYAPAL